MNLTFRPVARIAKPLLTAKCLLAMKLTIILLTVAVLHVSAKGYTQKVTLSVKNTSLEKVFVEIRKQTGYNFFYKVELLDEAKPVTVNVSDASLEQVLDLCFRDQPLSYTISGTSITVQLKKENTNENATENSPPLPPPPTDITGRITNEQGEPLAGASVIIKRTGRGDIADAKGDFHLKDVTNDDYIVISFAGYKTQTIKVNSITKFTIVMQVTDNDLDKVVIQAYGTTTQRYATGNITTVRAEEIERQPVMNPLQALQGKVPNLIVTQNNGYASSPFKVELRGRSVIDPSRSSEPLYIIDGVPLTVLDVAGNGSNYAAGSAGFIQNGLTGPASGQSPLFSINPEDIESISVLKDADATAIYGSRGANGVIIITTKKGKPGKTKFDFNVYQGGSEVTQHYNMLNTQQYLMMRREAFANDNITPDPGNAYDLLVWDTTRYTDWQKFLWGKTGMTTDIRGTLSGGDKQTNFLVSGTYHRETNILSVSGADQRTSVLFNLIHKSLDQRLNISITGNYSYANSDLINLPGSSTFSPDAPPPFDAQGHVNWSGWDPAYNYYGSLMQPYTSKTGFLNSRMLIQYELLKGLVFSTSLGYSTMHNSQLYLQPITSQNPLFNPTGQSDFGSNNLINSIVEPQLEYKKTIFKGEMNALIGSSLQSVTQDGNHIIGSGYTNDNLLRSVANAPTRSALDNNSQYKYAALFARITYNWSNKYIINLSARRDGSSRFGSGKQFGNFGSVGGAWIFTEENWFKKNKSILSFGKLRASYGTTGSDNIGDYKYLTQWSSINATYVNGVPSYIPLLHANPNLQWQVNKKLEAAINLGFLDDRINFELAWYRNRVGNELVPIPLPIITGFNQVAANFPATIQNRGLEATITADLVKRKEFYWSLTFNIGSNRNKLLSYPGLAQSPYASTYVVGEPLNIVKLLHSTGVDPQTGLYTFEDKNHDGQIDYFSSDTANDLYTKSFPIKFDGGIGTEIKYKNFSLNLFFHFRKQTLLSNIAYIGYPGLNNNFPVDVLNRWRKPGDKAQFARYTTQPQTSDFEFFNYSDGLYSDGSYIRLQNISLAFDFPTKFVKKVRMQSCKIFIRGENLFIITKYKGLDPDVPIFGGMPVQKVLTGGIQLNF